MILNVSARTDIVAFYAKWFMQRYQEGYVDVRNPFYPQKVSRIYFEDVEAILFCTKNPMPILPYITKIDKPILFHVTLTPYKKDIEPNLPPKGQIIKAIKKLSKLLGSDNVYVRYDPVIINDIYTVSYHLKAFDHLCSLLDGYIKHFIISFVDNYKNVWQNMSVLRIKNLTEDDYQKIGEGFAKSAQIHGMTVQTCFENRNLTEYGFIKSDCLSKELAQKLTNKTHFKKWAARQGQKCHCVQMVDIGVYNTCPHKCKYCYANYDEEKLNHIDHKPNSSLLIGQLQPDDEVKRRTA